MTAEFLALPLKVYTLEYQVNEGLKITVGVLTNGGIENRNMNMYVQLMVRNEWKPAKTKCEY